MKVYQTNQLDDAALTFDGQTTEELLKNFSEAVSHCRTL